VRVGATYAAAYSPASAQPVQPSGTRQTLHGNGEARGVLLFPLRAMLRMSLGTFMDIGWDLGWRDVGVQLRAGQLDSRRAWPWGIELEWRTHQHIILRDEELPIRVYRARAELYPALGKFGSMDAFGVLTVGVSTGTQIHGFSLPRAPGDPTWPEFELSQRETRLEMSLGAHGRGKPAAVTLAVLPWLALHQGRTQQACDDCGSPQIQSLRVPWGVSLAASGSLVWEKD
jgi:hypothetical protein